MTWDELHLKIGRDTISNTISIYTPFGCIKVYIDGQIAFDDGQHIVLIAKNRTPDQMYIIITAITETKE